MIRERISTQGIVRPLEHEDDLPAFTMDSNLVGMMPEGLIQRYLARKKSTEKKYASVIKTIAKQRVRNIERVRYKLARRAAAQRPYLSDGCYSTLSSPSRLAWILDVSECPPPSSIAGRLDVEVDDRGDQSLFLVLAAGDAAAGSYALKRGVAAMVDVLFARKLRRVDIANNGGGIGGGGGEVQ